MRRWLALVVVTDDGFVSNDVRERERQEAPVYLMTSEKSVKKLLENTSTDSGITVKALHIEEAIP